MPSKQGRMDGATEEGLTKNTDIQVRTQLFHTLRIFQSAQRLKETKAGGKPKGGKTAHSSDLCQNYLFSPLFPKAQGRRQLQHQTLLSVLKLCKIITSSRESDRQVKTENSCTLTCCQDSKLAKRWVCKWSFFQSCTHSFVPSPRLPHVNPILTPSTVR